MFSVFCFGPYTSFTLSLWEGKTQPARAFSVQAQFTSSKELQVADPGLLIMKGFRAKGGGWVKYLKKNQQILSSQMLFYLQTIYTK